MRGISRLRGLASHMRDMPQRTPLRTLPFSTGQIDPEFYTKVFVNLQPLFEAMGTRIASHLSEGEILDVGAGVGEPTLTLAKALPKCKILCTDVQQAMVDKAQARVANEGVGNVEFGVMSGDDLSTLEDGRFDAATANMVLMFVPDRTKMIQEMTRVLKPGGTAIISVWRELEFFASRLEALRELKGSSELDLPYDPLSCREEGFVERLAVGSLEHDSTELVSANFRFDSLEQVIEGSLVTAAPTLEELGGEESGAVDRYRKLYDEMLQAKGYVQPGGEVVFPGNKAALVQLRKAL